MSHVLHNILQHFLRVLESEQNKNQVSTKSKNSKAKFVVIFPS